MGRKPTPIDAGEIERLAALGLSFRAMAGTLGIPRATFHDRVTSDEILTAAYERGRARLGATYIERRDKLAAEGYWPAIEHGLTHHADMPRRGAIITGDASELAGGGSQGGGLADETIARACEILGIEPPFAVSDNDPDHS